MNKYLLSSLCLFALNNANADSQPLTLPAGTITAPAWMTKTSA
jgi:iron complex outermembrane receptor protein